MAWHGCFLTAMVDTSTARSVGVHRQARTPLCRRPDHRASVPAPRRRAVSPGGPERHRHRQPAPGAPGPQHDQALLCPRADQDRHPALPRGPDQGASGSASAAPQEPQAGWEAGMTPLCLVVDDWPEVDRERWRVAQAPAGFLEADKPASRWSPARRRIVEQAYGQWLAFLDRNGVLDPSCTPGQRATDDRLSEFVAAAASTASPRERRDDARRPGAHALRARARAGLGAAGARLQPPQADRGAVARQAGAGWSAPRTCSSSGCG